ncbi:MAG: hypothetical protein FWC96_07970 [Oscillospiraceae bacterium]|nr:hypothetical protein [Oscillospiraceae bacterium]
MGGERGTHYVYFYGVFDRIAPGGQTPWGRTLYVHINVDYVAAGLPEHIIPGESVRLVFPFSNEEWLADERQTPFDDLVPGERYFFKAGLIWWQVWQNPPMRGRLLAYPFGQGDWYISVPEGERLALTDPVLAEDIETHVINQRTMWITATVDMSNMPVFQPAAQTYMLWGGWGVDPGRFIDYEDYLNANPVAVVGHGFARHHGLEVGDTITLTLRDMQMPVIPYGYQGWREHPTQEIALTIVGLHGMDWRFSWSGALYSPGHLPTSFTDAHMYIPLSVLPPGFGGDETYIGLRDYSFTLSSPRNEGVFHLGTGQALGELGFEIRFFEHGGERFFDVIDPIILSVTVNLIVFSIVSLLVLALAAFIFLRQNRRNFVISRALGMPNAKALRRQIGTTALFWLPTIVIGSVWAWTFALTQAGETLAAVVTETGDYYEYFDYAYTDSILLPLPWLMVLCAIFAAAALLLILAGGLRTARRPVLELLQGQKVKSVRTAQSGRRTNDATAQYKSADATRSEVQLPQLPKIEKVNGGKRKTLSGSSMRFVLRHVTRAPVKTVLTILIAMFFVAALSWLRMTIDRTEQEIEILYETMPITAEIRGGFMGSGFGFGFVMDEMIQRTVMETVLGDEFIRDAYILAGYTWFNIVAPGEDGEFSRENLDAIWEAHDEDAWVNIVDPHFAVSCLETFIADSHGSYAILWGAEPFDIRFAEGFDESSFFYDDATLSAPIPVIVHERLLERRGLELGGIAYIADMEIHNPSRVIHQLLGRVEDVQAALAALEQENAQVIGSARVIGVYSGHTVGAIAHPAHRELVVMPLSALRFMRGDDITYITARLEIDPARNHELEAFQERLSDPLARNSIHMDWGIQTIQLYMEIFDDEFRLIITPMEQNLELLRILYPIAIIAAVVLGLGLSLLFMLQHAKNAAIMRVLGSTKRRTRVLLCVEQLMVTLAGIILALAAMPLFGMGFAAAFLLLAGLYLAGAIFGGLIGAIIISGRAPLALMQVRE